MKVLNKLFIVVILCLAAIGLGTCSPWEGYVVSLGGSSGGIGDEGYKFLDDNHYLDDKDEWEYKVTLSDGNKTIEETKGKDDSFELGVGIWDITVEVVGDRIVGIWEEKEVTVYAGTEIILDKKDMKLVATRVDNFDDFKTDFNNLNIGALGELEYIEIREGFKLESFLEVKKSIELRSEKDVTIDRTYVDTIGKANALFNIRDGGTLTLDGRNGKIVIDGGKDGVGSSSQNALINVHKGGTLIMFDGVTLTNNITAGGYGGGVWIGGPGGIGNPGGTFIMKGGTISDNTASAATGQGGGVYLNYGGIFQMEGGCISGNSATTNGGGVYVGNSTVTGGSFAKFTKTGGTITDSNTVNNSANVVYTAGGAGTTHAQTLGPNDNWPRP